MRPAAVELAVGIDRLVLDDQRDVVDPVGGGGRGPPRPGRRRDMPAARGTPARPVSPWRWGWYQSVAAGWSTARWARTCAPGRSSGGGRVHGGGEVHACQCSAVGSSNAVVSRSRRTSLARSARRVSPQVGAVQAPGLDSARRRQMSSLTGREPQVEDLRAVRRDRRLGQRESVAGIVHDLGNLISDRIVGGEHRCPQPNHPHRRNSSPLLTERRHRLNELVLSSGGPSA